MSNLGAYQIMTTLAKKVGGPLILAGLTALGGYIVLRPIEAGVTKGVKKLQKHINNKKSPIKKLAIYEATSDGEDKNGFQLHIGDKYRVLELDGDAVLVEKIGDTNNPYFVSSDFLSSVSNYTDNTKGLSTN